MPILTEGRHPGGFLVWEAFRDYCRETVTIVASADLQPGTVLGKVTASGKYAAFLNSATNGTETAVAVLWGHANAASGDAPAVVLLRGPAIVNQHDLVFAGSPSAADIAAAHAELRAAGIVVR